MEEKIGEKKTNKIGLIILIVVLVLGAGCGAFFLGQHFGDKKPVEPPKKEEKPAEISDATLINISVEKVNSDKTYEIQLAKKENKKYDSQTDEDKYVYAFYDKTNNRLITDFTYKNTTCSYSSETCINNPSEKGCIEKNVKIYTFRVNNEDYIYGTYDVNLCGGIESNYFIYSVNQNKVVKSDFGAKEVLKLNDGNIIIKLVYTGDEICAGWENGDACDNGLGFMFTYDAKFVEKSGIDAFEHNNNYIVVSRYEKSLLMTITAYDAKGNANYTINNVISYDKKYAAVVNDNKIVLYDINNNLLDGISAKEYDSANYYNPDLKVDNNTAILEFIEKEHPSETTELIPKKISFNLNK